MSFPRKNKTILGIRPKSKSKPKLKSHSYNSLTKKDIEKQIKESNEIRRKQHE